MRFPSPSERGLHPPDAGKRGRQAHPRSAVHLIGRIDERGIVAANQRHGREGSGGTRAVRDEKRASDRGQARGRHRGLPRRRQYLHQMDCHAAAYVLS